MFFRPDQSSRPVFPREFSADFVCSIMTGDSDSKVIRLADIEMPLWIMKDINPKHLSLAPAVGFEPTTNRLTADRSTTELRWIFSLAVSECISCPRHLWRQVLLCA